VISIIFVLVGGALWLRRTPLVPQAAPANSR
jgi:hypothetical protein